jgi:MFS family permease
MNRTELLDMLRRGLNKGTITVADLEAAIESTRSKPTRSRTLQHSRLTAVDAMFYITGIVLFASTMVLLGQSWDNSQPAFRIFMSAGLGTIFWAAALYLLRAATQNDIRRGLCNALLLAGSLSLIAGGFIIAGEFVDFDDTNFYAAAAVLAALGALHVTFGKLIRRDLIALIGVLLSVAAFPGLVFGLLDGSDVPLFIYSLVTAISAGLLAYAARVASLTGVSSASAARVFDSLSAFGVFASLYAASYDDNTGLLWLLVMIAGIIGLFYLSIVRQSKLLLGQSSLFLVVALLTISFRYFSGYGAAVSLLIAAMGLLGTAIIASTINRRYLK